MMLAIFQSAVVAVLVWGIVDIARAAARYSRYGDGFMVMVLFFAMLLFVLLLAANIGAMIVRGVFQ